ncbi:MAG: hypothetical protein H8D87_12760 [Deltaproteobacteria bacterium]|uniref:hypothetical protein n=1 Tax=Desulfobacula sp. TaxID=2593537 RepID=UPI00198AA12C|nr:hypothetical protein [Candidatus Desulfobacula maris]MBL6994455.1 hypothetical protein [Desulfobacula sp.]
MTFPLLLEKILRQQKLIPVAKIRDLRKRPLVKRRHISRPIISPRMDQQRKKVRQPKKKPESTVSTTQENSASTVTTTKRFHKPRPRETKKRQELIQRNDIPFDDTLKNVQ